MISRLTALGFLIFALAGSASAQITAPYTENFDGPVPSNWGVGNSSVEPVGWAFDGDPGIVSVGNGLGGAGLDGPTVGGSPGSLNYNDGLDYEEDVAMGSHYGTATSAPIDFSALAGNVSISFDINFETEFYLSGDPFPDQILVHLSGSTGSFPFEIYYAYVLTIGDNSTAAGALFDLHAGPMGTWKRVAFALPPFWTPTDTQLHFSFSTQDGLNNGYSGVFIDNVQICSDTFPPSAPTNLSPADGALLIRLPGTPLTLNWSDSVDTTACGPGGIRTYSWNIVDAATMLSVASGSRFTSDVTLPGGLPAGTYLWEASAIDGSALVSSFSTRTSFTIEDAVAPVAPGALHVNEGNDGAQDGESGTVDPVLDERPVFSAVFLDPNTEDQAAEYRMQISEDPGYSTLDYDSGVTTLAPNVLKGARSQDLEIPNSLNRGTVYFWRIQFADSAGLMGPFSGSQQFRIGDDFEFGVRPGSSNHSRRCYVATAAWGSETTEVEGLKAFRGSVLDRSGAGALFSRGYHITGQRAATLVSGEARRGATRAALAPLALAADVPVAIGIASIAGLMVLALAAVRRCAPARPSLSDGNRRARV